MPTTLLDTDQALAGLLAELQTLKSASQQMQNAERTTSRVVESAAKVAHLSAKVIEASSQQVASVQQLRTSLEVQSGKATASLTQMAERVDSLQQKLSAQIEEVCGLAGLNRMLLIALLILLLGNGALTFFVYQLLQGR